MTEQKAPPKARDRADQPDRFQRFMIDLVAGPSWLVITLAILLALLVGAVLIIVSDSSVTDKYGYFFASPGDAISASWHSVTTAYGAMLKGAIFDPDNASTFTDAIRPITETLTEAIPLIFGGLAIGLAFRGGMFNIGGQGQVIAGAIACCYVGFTLHAPAVVALPVAIIAGILGGAFWGGLVGWLKAATGAHEVIVTIMLNYVAYLFLGWLITTDTFQNPTNPQVSKAVLPAAKLPHLAGDQLRLNGGLIVAALAVCFAWWFLNRSTAGFELTKVGGNPTAAKTAGMSIGKNQIMAMVLSGGLMGLIGMSQVLGTADANNALSQQIDAGLGFTAITVALLGKASPVGTVLAALLFGALQAGGRQMQTTANVSIEIVNVVQSLIVLFVAAPGLIRGIFRLRGSKTDGALTAKGWNG